MSERTERPGKTGRSFGICHVLTAVWLLVCGAAVTGFSLYGESLSVLYRGKVFGIGSCLAMAVLAAFHCGAGELCWLELPAGPDDRRRAARMLLVFLAGTVLQILYAVYGIWVARTGLLQDSRAVSVIFCATALAAGYWGKRK